MGEEEQILYHAFGLSFGSNQLIPGLSPSQNGSGPPDVRIWLDVIPPDVFVPGEARDELYYTSTETDERGEPGFRIWRVANCPLLRLDYLDGTKFWLDRQGTKIWCKWPQDLTAADAAVYLLGPVIGLLLRLRGVTCLHASAVAMGSRAIAFAGSPGAGKSTTAAALARRGHAILSDDIVALEEREGSFLALPAHPYLGLWPESVQTLFGASGQIPAFSASWDKRRLSLADQDLKYQAQALPLAAVFILSERTSELRAPLIEMQSPSVESLLALVANSYGANVLDQDLRAREFQLLGRLAGKVAVYRLTANDEISGLNALCSSIENTCLLLDQSPPGSPRFRPEA
jgi:hypothetical protein